MEPLNLPTQCIETRASLSKGGAVTLGVMSSRMGPGGSVELVATTLLSISYASPGPEKVFEVGEDYEVTITHKPKKANDDNQKEKTGGTQTGAPEKSNGQLVNS